MTELEFEKDFKRNFPVNQRHQTLNGGQTVTTSINYWRWDGSQITLNNPET